MTVTKDSATTANRYLRDNFAPVTEELTATDLAVTGALPDFLDGRYLRIGPNLLQDPGERYHWFMGEGMVHGVRVRGGKAEWYRNRWVRSSAVAEALGEKFPARLKRLGVADVFGESGTPEALVAKHGLDAEGLAKSVGDFLRGS
jgi:carotenoid cleavage dioxygenase